jgi:hypothetical protein
VHGFGEHRTGGGVAHLRELLDELFEVLCVPDRDRRLVAVLPGDVDARQDVAHGQQPVAQALRVPDGAEPRAPRDLGSQAQPQPVEIEVDAP